MVTEIGLTATAENRNHEANRVFCDSRLRTRSERRQGVGFPVLPGETWRPEGAASAVARGQLGNQLSIFSKVFLTLATVFLVVTFCPNLAAAQTAKNLNCNGCVGSKDIKNNGVKSADIKNGQVKRRDIANGAVDGAKISDESLTSDDLATDSVTEDEIVDRTRNVSFPARAISFGSSVITPVERGLQWQQDFTGQGRLTFLKPSDHDGGDVTFKVFFFTTTDTAGAVDFFLHPDSFNPGDGFTEPAPPFVGAPAVLVLGTSGFGILYEQSFVIPAIRLQKNWWTINIQREGSESSYPDDVVVMSVALEYQAVQ